MKRKLRNCLMIMLVIILTAIPVISSADAIVEEFWELAYDVDYDVQVTAPDGGVNIRYGAGAEYGKVRDEMIKNGVTLHIIKETRASNGKLWGYTSLGVDQGWVFLGHCTKVSEIHNEVEIDEVVAPDKQQEVSGDVFADPDYSPTDDEQEEGVMKIDAGNDIQTAAPGSSTAMPMTTLILVIIGLLIVAVIITAAVLLKKMK